MASFKKIKFYLLLLSGLAISLIGIYIFFSSSVANSLLNLGKSAYAPDIYKNILGQGNENTSTSFNSLKTITINNSQGNSYTLNASIADTESLREKGLMNVKSMPDNQGMLFIFTDTPQIRTFWMKNTLIPLDMIFVDQNKKVTYVQHNASPCTSDPCQIYSSQFPSEYVIETNGGWALSHNIQPGDSVSF